MELNVVPRLAVSLTPEIAILPASQVSASAARPAGRELRVTVINGSKGPADGDVSLEVPAGWTVAPPSAKVSLAREDEAEPVRFTVTPPRGTKPGSYSVKAVVTAGADRFANGYQVVEYPHTRRRHLIHAAETTLKIIDVAIAPRLNIGYVMGVGDQVPPAIEQLGARVTLIDADGLAFGNLSAFDAIVTGVRAYERRPDLRANNHRLLDYAQKGGTVIVQYNKFEFNEAQYGPFPAKVSANRVTDERAPVQVLVPDHTVMRWPNRIGDATWQGVGPGARALLPRRQRREVRRCGPTRRPVPLQQGPEARRARGSAGGQGPVDVRGPGPVAAAAGGHRGRLPVAGEPLERGQGTARGGSRPQVTAGFDVIIVGGGPAGATAARSLARGGARALVLDRAAFPRNKPCGGGLTWRALKRFPDVEAALPRISTHAIRRIYMEAPGGASVSIETAEPTVVLVRRLEFDNLLMTMAREAGAEVAEGADITRVSEHAAGVRLDARDGRVFEAPIVVAADGVYSTVARRLGFNPGWPRDHVAIDMMEETPAARLRAVDDGTLWVSFAPGSGHGYGYIFPKRDYVNVGVGYVVSSFRTSIREAPYALHEAFVAGLKARGLLEGDADRSSFTPYQVPVGGPLRTTARGRVYLAGDAGGFVNGFSAEGIYFAMVTGDLAARAILARAVAAPVRKAVAARDRRRDAGFAVPEPVRVRRPQPREPPGSRRADLPAAGPAAGGLRERGGHLRGGPAAVRLEISADRGETGCSLLHAQELTEAGCRDPARRLTPTARAAV